MKRIISFALIFVLLVSMALQVFSEEAVTTMTVPAPSDWAKESVDIASELGITEKTRQYIYKEPITREEFCEMIYNLVNMLGADIEDANEDFADTDSKSVAALFTMGIINGKTETEFAPNDFLTREEAATIIVRMVNKVSPMATTEMWFEYDDINDISKWASDAVQTISNLGFMKGVGDNNFAPKETYTTEQAIITLVRVYEGAEAAGVVAREEEKAFEEFTVSEETDIDDFYVDEAIRLISESGKLAADRNFISMYIVNDEMTEKILAFSAVDFSKPTDIYYLSADREQIIANIEALAKADGVDIKDLGEHWFEHIWRKLNFSTLASLVNASYGAENLAALTILTNSRGYIMPEDFTNNFALFIQYEGDYSAIVSFYEYGDGVISANMSFVKNGEKDNVFRRITEIASALGEGSVKIARVK